VNPEDEDEDEKEEKGVRRRIDRVTFKGEVGGEWTDEEERENARRSRH